MSSQINSQQIQSILKKVEASFPHEDCYTCECYLGYLTRLELDAEKNLRPLFSQYKPEKTLIHNCMGCDPCPPADAFANYLQAKRLIDPNQIFG